MSINIKGQSCPVCHAYLFEEDDVVFCPICGAPHHRDCYEGIGHCKLEKFHGTEQQYDAKHYTENTENTTAENTEAEADDTAVVQVQCRSCGEKYSITEEKCPNCGTPNFAYGFNIPKIDILGGVPKNFDMGEGFTALDTAKFVGASQNRFLPKFAAFKTGKSVSFNIWSFLFPSSWFGFRKIYKSAFLSGIIRIASEVLMMPLTFYLSPFLSETGGLPTYLEVLKQNMPDMKLLLLFAIGAFLNFALRLVCGLFSDKIYFNHCISSMKKIREENPDSVPEEYLRKGSISPIVFLMIELFFTYGISFIGQLIVGI